MIGERLLRSLVPKPRKPVRAREAWWPIGFLLLFAVVCTVLVRTDTLDFARPWRLSLAAVAVWVWWMSAAGFSGLSLWRSRVALAFRLALVGLFAILIAEPRAVRTRDVISVVYAVDVSDSIGESSVDAALRFVAETVTRKPAADEAGLVVFGRDAAVELPPRMSFPFEAINSRIDRDATDLEQSLSLAAAMLPEENRGRIVLVSDGTETAGNLRPVLDQLRSRGIAVDVYPVQYDYDEEVWAERLDLPPMVKIGEEYEASIIVSSLKAGQGTLRVTENGERILDQPVEFQPGKNRYVVPIRLRGAGYYEYSATIDVPEGKDHLRENNTVLNYLFVEGEGKLLIVTDPTGDDRDWQQLAAAIRAGERAVDRRTAFEFPRDSLSLLPYDGVIFVNVAADAFDVVQLKALRDAVHDLGIGFLMVGGPNSFGPGGYHRTFVEEALPVTMDITEKKVLPKGALGIVLHTCEFAEGNTWGKRITKQAIKVLGARDEVGVLIYGFDGQDQWLFELTPASEYESLVTKINGAEIGDMPSFDTTMRMGLDALVASDAATRHMIIISDGDPSPPAPKLVDDFVKNKVSVSMVAINPHGGQDISTMQAIAGVTGGRYYFPQDPNQLPSIFIKESKTLRRSMIQNETITPQVGFPSSVLKGIDALPPLHGYVLTTLKSPPRAEGVLDTPPKGDEQEIDPVLAIGKFGLGTTAAFTSDLSPNWGQDWLEWDHWQPFVKQLMIEISRVRRQGHLRIWTHTSGNDGVIVVEDFHPQESFLEIQANVSGPRDRNETVTLRQVGPRRYQATVPLWGKGRYQVLAAATGGDRSDQAIAGFIVPYSPEYLRFRANPIVLNEIRERTGGVDLSELADDATRAEAIFGRREPKQSTRPVFDWILILLACAVPLDVGIRRVQLDWHVIKGWFGFGARKPETTRTMGALLERKQAIDGELEPRRIERPVASPPSPRPSRPVRPAAPSAPTATGPSPDRPPEKPESTDQPAGKPMSTMERLLAEKRKRERDGRE